MIELKNYLRVNAFLSDSPSLISEFLNRVDRHIISHISVITVIKVIIAYVLSYL